MFISFRDKHDGAKAGTARQFAISVDGGTSLTGPFRRLPLAVLSVEGSALALTGTHSGELLFSAPADTRPILRRDLTIFVSRTSGAGWSRRYQVELESTPAAYSDLVQLDDGSIGVIYETGVVTWKERIAFESIPVPALSHPDLAVSRLSSARSAHPTPASAHARVRETVRVHGITSPPGRVTLTYRGAGRQGSTSIDLTYSNRGVRLITVPRLRRATTDSRWRTPAPAGSR